MGNDYKGEIAKKIKAIIFDFDYTLADSSKGVEQCIYYGLKSLNLPIPPPEEIYKTIGLSLKETFLKLAGTQYRDEVEAFSQLFIEKADQVMADLTVMFKDVQNVIHLLKNHGITLGIVSTKFRYRIESILKRENLLECFDVIIGGEDVKEHKPNPEGLMLAIQKANCSPSLTLYIGDSITDAETAKRAGVSFAPVLSGTTLQKSFKVYNTFGILKSISELPSMLGIYQ